VRRTEATDALYPLLTATCADGRQCVVKQGTVGHIAIEDDGWRAAFIELLASAPRPSGAAFGEGEARWTLDIHVQPASVAIVAGRRPGAFDPTVRESLELAASGAGKRASCDIRLQSLGLLPGVAAAARLSTLSWTQRVELDFLQAWLQRPEWLVFDAVFDHPDAASVAHLPRLFHHRFPLRAMSFVGRARPDLPGAPDAPTLRFRA
jgi:hypothetical protein